MKNLWIFCLHSYFSFVHIVTVRMVASGNNKCLEEGGGVMKGKGGGVMISNYIIYMIIKLITVYLTEKLIL